MDTHLECPSCHQLDRVVNVRAAYENGTTSTSQHGSALTITPDLGLAPTMMHSRGSTVSGLSQKLDSLEERPKTSQGGCAPILAVGVPVIIAAGSVSGKPMSTQIVVEFVGLLAGIGLFLLLRIPIFRNRAVVLPWWESYMELWCQLFYCERCDIVYDPARPDEAVHVSRMHEYLISRLGKRP